MFGAAKSWEDIHTFGFKEGRSATEIAAAMRFMASTAHEWCNELGVFVASMDAKHAFDNVTPENLSKAMKELEINPVLAEAILRKQIRGKYGISFQEMTVSGIPFDTSIKQGGKESPSLFNMMMHSVFMVLQEKWR